jgi:hypothetical protein
VPRIAEIDSRTTNCTVSQGNSAHLIATSDPETRGVYLPNVVHELTIPVHKDGDIKI